MGQKENDLKCPSCGSPLKYRIEKTRSNSYSLFLFCENCGFYAKYELETEEQITQNNKNSGDADIKNINFEAMPTPAKLIFDYISRRHGKVVYGDILYGEPPELGPEITEDLLERWSLNNTQAKKLLGVLRSRGITRLYEYQARAIESILEGNDTVIVAQTAMGKTEAFVIPIIIKATKTTHRPYALIIYPTKALARDQEKKIKLYSQALGLKVGILDGDTPWSERAKLIRDPPHILITNFDIINYWLAKKTRSRGLADLFINAEMIVIDEAHEYYGSFGTHVYYIIKRLKRLARKKIQIVMSSATILNPEEFAKQFIGGNPKVIQSNGRRVALYTMFIYTSEPPFRIGAYLLALLVSHGIKTILFMNTRQNAELAYNVIRRDFKRLKNTIEVHRAGISKKLRKSIEERFRSGTLKGIISTPTLELGIDIGDVQAVITDIVPADRFIQRSGRSGRRGEMGTAILILRADDPISEYYARNPKEYFLDISGRYIEPRNPLIAKRHVYLMAYEKPLRIEELKQLGVEKIADILKSEGALICPGNLCTANGLLFSKYFTRNIRGIDITVDVIDVTRDKVIDQREILVALKELYPNAIYLYRGKKYQVASIDIKNMQAYITPIDPNLEYYYTKPLYTYSAIPLEILDTRTTCGTKLYYALLKMKLNIIGYLLFREGQRKPIIQEYYDAPISYEYQTYGIFFRAPPITVSPEAPDDAIRGAFHATEHILIEGTYRITGGSEYDLGGISYGETGVIVIHEAIPGGNGVSRLLYERFEEAVLKTYQLLTNEACRQKEEINKCVFSYHCGNNNKPLYQKGARIILEKMLKNIKTPNAEDAPHILEEIEKGIA